MVSKQQKYGNFGGQNSSSSLAICEGQNFECKTRGSNSDMTMVAECRRQQEILIGLPSLVISTTKTGRQNSDSQLQISNLDDNFGRLIPVYTALDTNPKMFPGDQHLIGQLPALVLQHQPVISNIDGQFWRENEMKSPQLHSRKRHRFFPLQISYLHESLTTDGFSPSYW